MAEAKMQEQAKNIFAQNKGVKTLWVNKKGEFFTNENLAKQSVKDPKELEVIERKAEKAEAPAAVTGDTK